jgi:transposase
MAERFLLARPGKRRVIAESTTKTDRLEAQILVESLVHNLIPEAHRPFERQRPHRALVRHRPYLPGRLTATKVKIGRLPSDSNVDRKDLFTAAGEADLATVRLQDSDRFVLDQLRGEATHLREQLAALHRPVKQSAAAAPTMEAEARAVLKTIPGVGPVTIDVVVSALGDVSRFRNAKPVCASAGLVPAVRQSTGKGKELGITKTGSPLRRGALVEAAWRLVRQSGRWRSLDDGLKKRRRGKKAIVAVARRLSGVMTAMLGTMKPYRLVSVSPLRRCGGRAIHLSEQV